MHHLLKRHWFPVEAEFDYTLALTFALPAGELRPLLYPGLELDEYDGLGFLAIALVKTHRLRPAFMPRFLGRDFFLTGYRLFVRYTTRAGRRLRGLQVLRSDTDSAFMARAGNWLTHYRYEKARIETARTPDTIAIEVATPSGAGDLSVQANLADRALPPGSPFPDEHTARRFAGPMPFTFSYEPHTGSIVRVEGKRSGWHPKIVSATVRRAAFLRKFASEPRLASAFYLERVPYRWEGGITEKLPEPMKQTNREPFEGVTKIVRFNWPMFAAAGGAAAAAAGLSQIRAMPEPARRIARYAAGGTLAQTLVSLAVSYYVYDLSPLTRWEWLARKLPAGAKRIFNIHSGFDETTSTLRRLLPETEIRSVDLYDAERTTEPSLARARRAFPPPSDALPGAPERLPAEDRSVSAVLFLFSAHELRQASERRSLFREAARITEKGGVVVLVEHMRDLANWLAYGPGFFHFHSARTWLADAGTALRLRESGRMTPFVRWYIFEPRR